MKLSGMIQGMDCVAPLNKKYRPSKPENKLTLERLHVQLAGGLSMLAKCNRDIPRSSYELRPGSAQKKRALEQLKLMRSLLRELSESMTTMD